MQRADLDTIACVNTACQLFCQAVPSNLVIRKGMGMIVSAWCAVEAVEAVARKYGRKIAMIPAGERWQDDGSLRPSFEDLIGAGAIINHLKGRRSPEALVALAAFRAVESELDYGLHQCSSGKELLERGFATDVAQFIAVCSAYILAETLCHSASLASQFRAKRSVS